jgi:hypothetical protein
MSTKLTSEEKKKVINAKNNLEQLEINLAKKKQELKDAEEKAEEDVQSKKELLNAAQIKYDEAKKEFDTTTEKATNAGIKFDDLNRAASEGEASIQKLIKDLKNNINNDIGKTIADSKPQGQHAANIAGHPNPIIVNKGECTWQVSPRMYTNEEKQKELEKHKAKITTLDESAEAIKTFKAAEVDQLNANDEFTTAQAPINEAKNNLNAVIEKHTNAKNKFVYLSVINNWSGEEEATASSIKVNGETDQKIEL